MRSLLQTSVSSDSTTTSIVNLLGAGSTLAAPVYQAASFAYQFLQNIVSVNLKFNPPGVATGSGAGKTAVLNGAVNFAGSDSDFSAAQYAGYSDILLLPTMAAAVVPIYNLPHVDFTAGLSPSGRLVLNGSVLTSIFQGSISMWNDSAIAALNPTAALPAMPITVVVRSDSSGTSNVFTHALAAFSASWAAQVNGVADLPTWPPALSSRLLHGNGNPGVLAVVNSIPYSIGYSVYGDAVTLNIPFASMYNHAGVIMDATISSITAAVLELGGSLDAHNTAQLVDAHGMGAWPIAGYTYACFRTKTSAAAATVVFTNVTLVAAQTAYISAQQNATAHPGDQYASLVFNATAAALQTASTAFTAAVLAGSNTGAGSATCVGRRELVKFWQWYYTSSVVQSILEELGFVSLPNVLANVMVEKLFTIKCDDNSSALYVAPTNPLVFAGSSVVQSALTSSMLAYRTISSDFLSTLYPFNSAQAQSLLPNGLAILASILSAPFSAGNIVNSTVADVTNSAAITTLPYALGCISVYHSVALLSSTVSPAPSLTLNYAILSGIYRGTVRFWNDSTIAAQNPHLMLPVTPITVIVTAQPSEITQLFRNYMSMNDAAFAAQIGNGDDSRGFAAANMVTVDTSDKLSLALLNYPNAVTVFVRIDGALGGTPANLVDSTGASVSCSIASLQACIPAVAGLDAVVTPIVNQINSPYYTGAQSNAAIDLSALPSIVTELFTPVGAGLLSATPQSCYPLTFSWNFQTHPSFSSQFCNGTFDTTSFLMFMTWLYSGGAVNNGISTRGLLPLTESLRELSVAWLQHVTCDGKSILRTFPTGFSFSGGMQALSAALCALGLLLCTAIFAGVLYYRRGAAIRAASVPFLALVTGGSMLQYAMLPLLTISLPTDATCMSQVWLFSIGFVLCYGSQFFKTYRIWRIFAVRRLQKVVIPNELLSVYSGALVLADAIILTVFTAYAPLVHTQWLDASSNIVHDQCGTSNNSPLGFFIALLAFKAVIMSISVAIAFMSRNASSEFNESKAVGAAIYMCSILLIIIAPAVGFLWSNNSRLAYTVLLVIGIFWNSTSTLLVLIAPKIYLCYKYPSQRGYAGSLANNDSVLQSTAPAKYVVTNSAGDKVVVRQGHSGSSVSPKTSAALTALVQATVKTSKGVSSGKANNVSAIAGKKSNNTNKSAFSFVQTNPAPSNRSAAVHPVNMHASSAITTSDQCATSVPDTTSPTFPPTITLHTENDETLDVVAMMKKMAAEGELNIHPMSASPSRNAVMGYTVTTDMIPPPPLSHPFETNVEVNDLVQVKENSKKHHRALTLEVAACDSTLVTIPIAEMVAL